ncbi:hypothetical protein KC19_4G259800 [Ceratodon purpureus]|uniref:MICOS complex subunit MIC60 n=1 Tax=Ceratodon purpureus TaxID=3225 RepID=A0A8T0IGD2_CERPU|nr:hypothetical protein KC19_4G259800 [Ceratodon purpureus]
MSAASSLLRRRSWRVLTSLVKHRQRELEGLTVASRGHHYGFRDFTTSERIAPSLSPRGLVQDRKSLLSSCGAYRKFATSTNNSSVPPGAPPEAPQGSIVGTGTKVTAVAVTLAALSWAAAYLAFDVKPADLTKYFPQPAKEEKGVAFDVIGKESRPPEPRSVERPSTEAKPMAREESNILLQVVKETPLMPKAIEDFEREPHGIVDSGFQIKDLEDVESSPQISVENDSSKELQQSAEESAKADIGGNNSTNIDVIEVKKGDGQSYPDDSVTEVREEIGQSLANAFWIDPVTEVKDEGRQSPSHDTITEEKELVVQSLPSAFSIDSITEEKDEIVQSLPSAFSIDPITETKDEVVQFHPHDTVPEVNAGSTGSEGPSGQPDLPVDTNGQSLPSTSVEDLEPDAFRKEMQETAKEEDLKEFSDKILYNQTRADTDEKQAVCSTDAGDDLQNVVTETIEAVSDLAQAFQNAGLDLLQPDVAEVKVIPGIPGIAEAYHLDKKESEESCAEEYGSDQFFKYAGAIEEAEKRQFETDEQFREMLLKLDEEYQQELREARKQQEEQTEYAKKLKKDLSVEKARWEEQARQQLHAAEERLRNELKRKEEEAKRELEKMELLTQARTNAAVTAEKARHLEDTKELQMQVEALHRAFNTRSEGARVSHTTHKLAMGAFAFEDAMSRGAPLEEEVELLKQAAGGNDELIDVALQSLPEEALTKGTKTQIQLEREFARLRGPLRQLALIPAGQGGLLTHAIATAVAAMKVREGTGREGVESVIATVEECLANGELSVAANILEQGVKGSRAEPFVSDWARHVRSRVIAEQALALVQAHAIATAAGLA